MTTREELERVANEKQNALYEAIKVKLDATIACKQAQCECFMANVALGAYDKSMGRYV